MSGSPEKKMSEDAQNAKVSTGIRKRLTQERLREILDYNPETGIFTWRQNRPGGVKSGTQAGCICSTKGYHRISADGNLYLAHRLAFLWMDGYLPENGVDHIDRIKTNNKWKNLREASKVCNARNCGTNKINKSGIVGVYFKKEFKKWCAEITINGKKIHLGYSVNIHEVVFLRWEAEVKYGWPNCNSTSSAYLYIQSHKDGRL